MVATRESDMSCSAYARQLGAGTLSSLKVRQIKAKLLELFQPHLDLSDLNPRDEQLENKTLTRCLAAFAIYERTGCTPAEAAAAVWDGVDDNGIDAAYYDPSDARVYLVQAKWIHAGSGEPAAADLGIFADGVRDVIEQEQANFAARLHGKLHDIGQALNVPGTSIEILLVTTGASELATHGDRKLERVLTELNGEAGVEPSAFKAIMGLIEVYAALATDKEYSRIALDATILDWSFVAQPEQAYFGVIDGLQLKEWWSHHGKRLVAKNIRHALGSTEVNTQIRNTAINDPEHFWYFNNGITLIAEEAVKAPRGAASRASGNFQFKGASIVNGAQTVSTLGRVEDDTPLGQVRVPIRVILLQSAPDNFGREVTRANNLQNRVEPRDFVAQDPEQARIQMEMAIEGVDYQFLRSGDFTVTADSCDLIEVTTALACATGDPAYAVTIKTGIGRFFADLNRAPYKALFNPALSGTRAFNATVTLRHIEVWIAERKKVVAKKSGYPWGVLIHGNRVLAAAVFSLLGRSALDHSIEEYRQSMDGTRINQLCEEVYNRMVTSLEAHYPGRFLAVLFKSPTMSKQVFDDATKV